MPRRLAISALALALALAACAAPDAGYGTTRSPITGGTPESGYLAVFSLAYEGQGGCTGTCITPKVGLTATHCVAGDPASAFTALFGTTEQAPTQVIQVDALATAPAGGDIAALAFAEACPAVIPYNRTALEAHVGEPVVMVGFGVTTEDADDAGIKRSGTATLFSVDPAAVPGMEDGELATSNDPDGTCNGDSGGPTFMTFGGVEYMAGTTSRGSLMNQTTEWPCGQGRSIAVRADSYADFIDDFIAEYDPDAVPPPDDDPPGDDAPGDDAPPGDDDPSGGDDEPGSSTNSGGCHVGGGSSGGGGLIVLALGLIVARRRRGVSRR